MRLRLVIFDCDGVLIDSEPVCNRIVARELTRLGWAMTPAECERQFVGISFPDMREVVARRVGRPVTQAWEDALVAEVAAAMAREAALIPGAREAIAGIEALGLDWCVASNSSHQEMAAKFGCVGMSEMVAGRLHSFLDVIAEGGRGKPAPDLFLRAARLRGAASAECLVIEDSEAGVRGAVAAGMRTLGYCPRDDASGLAEAGATVFRNMAELPSLLPRLMRGWK